ncbi:MAG: PhoU domain-containing protein [Candidatus Jordarchaeales archaeon]|nr:potassium channel protein [Candidatus Jordarchaeia archaeon]
MKNDEVAEIEKMIVEMKNTSELMLDLAYSAFFFNNKEIAEEVMELEELFDKFHVNFELKVLDAEDEAINPEAKLALIRIGLAAENIADAAAEIADAVLRGVEPHPILKMVMEEADETIVRTCIGDRSELEGKTIGEIAIDDRLGMRIIAVRRKGKWVYSPSDSYTLEKGDVIIAKGYTQGKELLLEMAKGEKCEV